MILTFGTRGDVQPFIPLALEMKARGMNPLIVTLPLFKHLIEGSGIAFANIVEDDDAAAPIVDDESEDFFLHGVAHFYDKHGDAMVNRVQLLVASHRVDCIVLGSLIFFLKWLRTLNLPLVHSRLAPYAAKPGESGLEAHAQDVVHFLSISRSYGFAQCIKEEARLPDQATPLPIPDFSPSLIPTGMRTHTRFPHTHCLFGPFLLHPTAYHRYRTSSALSRT
jgi:hypothetical protein